MLRISGPRIQRRTIAVFPPQPVARRVDTTAQAGDGVASTDTGEVAAGESRYVAIVLISDKYMQSLERKSESERA
jgi:hypothetical protein